MVDYLVRATSFLESEIAAAEAGILTDLSNTYPMIVDSKAIRLRLDVLHSTFFSFFNAQCFFFNCLLLCLFNEGGTELMVEPNEVFFGNEVRFTCGPPPASLNFGPDWTAEWRREGSLVLPDSLHSFTRLTEENTRLLTVSRFFNTDSGKEINSA